MEPADTFQRIPELHFITPIENIPSILKKGILSNEQAAKHNHTSVANSVVQDRREGIRIPNGLALHQYANLYIDARNPMLYYLMSNSPKDLCILIVDKALMTMPAVVISDRNASSRYANFHSYSEAMAKLDIDAIYAQYWTHPDDPIEEMRHQSIKCAEVLVPHHIDPKFISGAYVPDSQTREALISMGFDKEIFIDPYKFFNKTIRRR